MGNPINRLNDIKLVSVTELKPHPDNPNNHPDDQIERLADIIQYQGWRYPIKVSTRSGFITAGHGRLMAAQKRGWTMVPVSYQDYDSDDQEWADVVADNSIASWAELDLAKINFKIPEMGPDFNIDLMGIRDFKLDPSELENKPIESPKSAATFIECPHCGEQFEKE